MLKGRLGLDTAKIPYKDRHGLVYLDRGELKVIDGCVHFIAAGSEALQSGDYSLPHQTISMIMLGPGGTVSHDAIRTLSKHGVGILCVGTHGVRLYTAPPLSNHDSSLARIQAECWANKDKRIFLAKRMYAMHLGELFPNRDIAALRGIEGVRVKESYKMHAQKAGIKWSGRVFDRQNPESSDLPNQAINHTVAAVEAAASIAVAATATIPQLGFIHEDAGHSFVLDIADLFREQVTIPIAFSCVAMAQKNPNLNFERTIRQTVGEKFFKDQVISGMIDKIKALLTDLK